MTQHNEPQPTADPVAWMYRKPDGPKGQKYVTPERVPAAFQQRDSLAETPLYDHPPATLREPVGGRCGDGQLCPACSAPITELVQQPGCGGLVDDGLVECIRETLMSMDHPVSDWELEFAKKVRALPEFAAIQSLRAEVDYWHNGIPFKNLNLQLDELRAEIARLTECLTRANASTEKYEREFYLAYDKITHLCSQIEHKDAALRWYAEQVGRVPEGDERRQ